VKSKLYAGWQELLVEVRFGFLLLGCAGAADESEPASLDQFARRMRCMATGYNNREYFLAIEAGTLRATIHLALPVFRRYQAKQHGDLGQKHL